MVGTHTVILSTTNASDGKLTYSTLPALYATLPYAQCLFVVQFDRSKVHACCVRKKDQFLDGERVRLLDGIKISSGAAVSGCCVVRLAHLLIGLIEKHARYVHAHAQDRKE